MRLIRTLYTLIVLTFAVSWPAVTKVINCPPAMRPQQSKGVSNSTHLVKPQTKWKVPTYLGLTLGKSREPDVVKALGKPIWSGMPEDSIVEENRENELWYEYGCAEGFAGRTTVVMNSKGVVVAVLVYLKKPLPLTRALELYGESYLKRQWYPCRTERDLSQIKPSDRSGGSFFLVYPEQGMYLLVGEHKTIWEIGYLLRCP